MSRRGRPPKPTNLRVIEGNRGHRPINEFEPQFEAADKPTPPAHLHKFALEEWGRVSDELYSAGILTTVDRAALAAYCQAYARWRIAEEAIAQMALADPKTSGLLAITTNGNVIQNPLVSTANAAMRDMMRYAAELGMTASARSRIEGKRGEEDPISKKYFGG